MAFNVQSRYKNVHSFHSLTPHVSPYFLIKEINRYLHAEFHQ